MSDFFRIHAPPEYARLTLGQLSRMVHEAEETDDDVTLIQVFDELEKRGIDNSLFMEFYRIEWRRRMEAKKTKEKGDN
jgi:hypothetical protein